MGGGQGSCGCENSKKIGGGRGPGRGGVFFWGGEGGCERRSEVILKIQKKYGDGGGGGVGVGREVPVGGVRVDVNEELKLL